MGFTNENGFDDGLWLFAILALFGFGGNGFFGGGNNRVGEQYATQADIQRAVDLNAIMKGQTEIERAIQDTAASTIGAVKDGNYNILGELRDITAENGRGFSSLKDCCCDLKSMVMENRYLSERNANVITTAIKTDGDLTRTLLNQMERDRLRDDLTLARSENADYKQSQFMLGQMGRWVSNPPCYGPCGASCGN